MPGISLAMIIKNEAETIEKTIASALPCCEQMVVLIDKSTTDDTLKKINKLKRADDVMLEYVWIGSFSNTRNLAARFCKYEWILVMDGHEVLDDAKKLRYVWEQHQKDTDLFLFLIRNIETTPSTLQYQIRLYRNDGTMHYVNEVHNHLAVAGKDKIKGIKLLKKKRIKYISDITIIHNRSEELINERAVQRSAMVRKLEPAIRHKDGGAAAGTKENGLDNYYIAGRYYDEGNYDKATEYFGRNDKDGTDSYLRYVSLLYLGQIAELSGDVNDAIGYYRRAMQVPRCELLPSAYLFLGQLYEKKGDIHNTEVALEYYKFAQGRNFPLTGVPMVENHFSYAPHYAYARGCLAAVKALLKNIPNIRDESQKKSHYERAHWFLNVGFTETELQRRKYEGDTELSKAFLELGEKILDILVEIIRD